MLPLLNTKQKGNRFADTFVDLTLVAQRNVSSHIKMLTTLPRRRFDTNSPLRLEAAIITSFQGEGTAQWSCTIGGSTSMESVYPVDIEDIATTSTIVSVEPVQSVQPFETYLVIAPNTLQQGVKYTFTLTYNPNVANNELTRSTGSKLKTSWASSWASITIETNMPPQPGMVSVTPTWGYGLLTKFTMVIHRYFVQY